MKKIIFILLTLALLTACAPTTPPPGAAPTRDSSEPMPTSMNTPVKIIPPSTAIPSGELLRISGQGNFESETFTVTQENQATYTSNDQTFTVPAPNVRVNYKTSSDARVQISIVALNPDPAQPQYSGGVVGLVYNPTESFTEAALLPGEYKIVVDVELDAVWEVWVEEIK